ncbi:hypothetical protein E3V55_00915 [Candidatus Marinimicrobia bacterium MT.SAG.3]|nr:hypothetical protein E3V55_00915 [Candidatus Marinimicrobia bacterium MT.SAG.3]
MRFPYLLLLSFIFLIPSSAMAQHFEKLKFKLSLENEVTPIKSKSPKGAMIRSAIFPGWGQVYNKKYTKALVYLGGELYFASRYISLDDKIKKLVDDGEDELTIEDKEHERNGWLWLLGAGYLLALGDAFVDAHLYGLYDDKKLSVRLRTVDRSGSLQMQLNFTF